MKEERKTHPAFKMVGPSLATKGNDNSPNPPLLIVDQILDNYVAAGQPTVKKRKLKPKSPTSIRNEQYSLHPLRIYFGRKIGERLTLADCDGYHAWRNQGGYVSKFN